MLEGYVKATNGGRNPSGVQGPVRLRYRHGSFIVSAAAIKLMEGDRVELLINFQEHKLALVSDENGVKKQHGSTSLFRYSWRKLIKSWISDYDKSATDPRFRCYEIYGEYIEKEKAVIFDFNKVQEVKE